jgi:hypothetical protein
MSLQNNIGESMNLEVFGIKGGREDLMIISILRLKQGGFL